MKILVCIKQVPDIESPLEIDFEKLWIRDTALITYRMNHYDEYALEEAVQIKESFSDTIIDAITVGHERAQSCVKKALEKGADNGIHILLNSYKYDSPFTIARLISEFARSRQYDLILTGVMAEDDMQCLVGPLVAAILHMPCATSVMKETLNINNNTITVDCEMEQGTRETITISLPCVLTIQSGINRPRYPSLSNVLRAKSQEIHTIDSSILTVTEPNEDIIAISYPEKSSHGVVLNGSTEDKAEKLIKILHEKSLL